MPILTPSDVHIDKPLSNLTLAYVQSADNFVASKVFPVIGVDHQSDYYYTYDRANMNRDGDVAKVAPRTELETIGMAISSTTYTADVYGLAMDFDEQTLANEDAALEIRAAGAETLAMRMLIDRENKWASTFFATGVWTTEVDGVASATPTAGQRTHWSDTTNGTPIVDVTTARRDMMLASGGFKPNTMVVGKEVRDQLINHPDILNRLNGGATVTNTALVTDAKLAEIFEVENFFVMEAIENTGAEGLAESNAFIGGKHAMLCYTPASAGKMIPASGATFSWNNIRGVNNLGVSVESFSGDWLRVKQIAERIEVKMAYDMKVVGADLGYFFNGIVA